MLRVVGGLHAGYNWQTGSVVWGIEGDIEASGVEGDRAARGTFSFAGVPDLTITASESTSARYKRSAAAGCRESSQPFGVSHRTRSPGSTRRPASSTNGFEGSRHRSLRRGGQTCWPETTTNWLRRTRGKGGNSHTPVAGRGAIPAILAGGAPRPDLGASAGAPVFLMAHGRDRAAAAREPKLARCCSSAARTRRPATHARP